VTNIEDVSVSVAGEEKDPAKIAKIEAEIDQTRDAITGDLRTLGERLSPEHLKQEAREVMMEAKNVATETLQEAKNVATTTFREVKESALEAVNEKVEDVRQTVRSAEQEAIGFVRENAIPLALMGIGVAWFVSNRRSRELRWDGQYAPRGQGRWRYPETSSAGRASALEDARDGIYRAGSSAREYSARARNRAQGWVDDTEQKVGDVAGRVKGFADREMDEARGLARDAQQRLGRATSQAKETAERELRQFRDFSMNATESHPLAVGAAAVAAGICVGLLIPETRRENEWLGPQRDRLSNGAKDAVSGAKEAISDLKHTAKETARDVRSSFDGVRG
jgi:ElaB/YqjD/DUF883 family membrane-anchored ribosome-binding protein